MQRNQQGFTLIELVIVIVILGILSAFALPRFADLGADARQASLEGAAGAVRSSASIARSAWLAAGDEPDTLELDGVTIAMSGEGFPAATQDDADNSGIIDAAQLDSNDYSFDESTVANDTITITLPDTEDGNCEFTYNQDTGRVTDLANCT